MNKETWNKLSVEEKNKLVEENIVGKPGRYDTSWTAAMWLLGYITRERPDLAVDFSYSLFENWPVLNENNEYGWKEAATDIASWTPDFICYCAVCASINKDQ